MSRRFNRVATLAGVLVPAALAFGASSACAGNVGVDLNLHLGDQPVVVGAPAPAVVAPAPVVIDQDVDFVYPEGLGVYAAVGVPYDLFYTGNCYYMYRDGRWLRAYRGRGTWAPIGFRSLPPGLRRHNLARMRAFRDAEYDVYRHDRGHYRGRHFFAGRDEWRMARGEGRGHWREGHGEHGEHGEHHGRHHDD